MFLAIKEIRKEKLRYSLIVLMIFLISYLIFMLSALAAGLAGQNTQAVESWQTKQVVLNKNANINMSQSLLTKTDLANAKLTANEALVGQTAAVIKKAGRSSVSAQFVGLDKTQYIYEALKPTAGKKVTKNNEITVDDSLKTKGYQLGDQVTLNGSSDKYRIVGFVKNAKLNIAPVIYGTLTTWKNLRQGLPNVEASAIISKDAAFSYNHKNAQTYHVQKFISKLPGYTAQNLTFELMIGFLFVISLIVIAVFLYILTMQKLHNFAVMRAQGIPSKTLVNATICQALILVITGLIVAVLLMGLTIAVLPSAVPISFTSQTLISGVVGMLLTGVIGSLIPIRSILKVDPAKAIGD